MVPPYGAFGRGDDEGLVGGLAVGLGARDAVGLDRRSRRHARDHVQVVTVLRRIRPACGGRLWPPAGRCPGRRGGPLGRRRGWPHRRDDGPGRGGVRARGVGPGSVAGHDAEASGRGGAGQAGCGAGRRDLAVGFGRRDVGRQAVPGAGDGTQELPGVGRAQVRIPARGQGHQGVQRGRQPGDQPGGRRDSLVDVPVRHRQGGVAGKRLTAGEQLEQHDPGRVHVGAEVGPAAGHLLRGEIGGGADEQAALGVAHIGEQPGQAEVRDLDRVGVPEQHVFRLDVTVRDPGRVRGGQPGQDALDDVERLARAQPGALVQQVPQGPAGHVLHGQVQGAPVGALVVHGDHVRVGKPGDRPGLGDEPPDEVLVAGELRMHDLQRDRAVEPSIGAQVDGRHPAVREMGLHPVPAIKELADRHAGQGRIHCVDSKGET